MSPQPGERIGPQDADLMDATQVARYLGLSGQQSVYQLAKRRPAAMAPLRVWNEANGRWLLRWRVQQVAACAADSACHMIVDDDVFRLSLARRGAHMCVGYDDAQWYCAHLRGEV